MQKERESNFELLRIVSMLMIVAHHFVVHGSAIYATDLLTVNRVWLDFLRIGGKLGSDIFMLISGYFLISAKTFSIKKLLKLWGALFFWTVIFQTIAFFAYGDVSIKDIIKLFLPVIYSKRWFASVYFVIYLLSPYLNKLLNSLDKAAFLKMLIVLGICWSAIPSLTNQMVESNNLVWFIYLYCIAAYIRLWGKSNKKSSAYLTTATIGIIIVVVVGIALMPDQITDLYAQNRLWIAGIAVLLLLGFKNIRIKNNSMINTLASATYGVYLIHDNGFSEIIDWQILQSWKYAGEKWFILYSVLIIIGVYSIATILDLARIKIIEPKFLKISSPIERLVKNAFAKVYQVF